MKILWLIGLLVVGAWARPEADPTGDPNRNSEDASRAFIPHDWINIDGIGVSRCTQVGDMYVARSWGECHICGCFPSYNGIYAKCAPCRACINGAVPIPIPAPVPQPWPVPIEEPWPAPIPQPWPVPIPQPRPIPIPEPINPICPPPVIIPGPPRPYPVPVPVPGKNVLVPVPVPIPSEPEKIYVQGPSVPVPVPVETRVPYPVAVDRPYPVRSPPQIIPIPFPEPVPGPEVEVPVPVPVPSPPIRVPYPVNRYIPVPGPAKLVPVPVPVPVDNPKYYPVPVIYYVSPICRNHRPLEPFTIPGEPCNVYVCKVQYHYVYVDTVTLPYCDTPAYGPFIGGHTGYRGAEANALANAISLGGGNAIANADANAIAGGFGGLGGLGGPGGLGGFGGYGGAEANALANAVSLGGGNAFSNAEANALAGGYGGLGSLGGFPGYGGLPGYEGYPGYGGLPGHEGYPGFRGTEANALANAVSIGGGNAYSNAEANALAGGYGGLGSLGGFPGYGGLPGYEGYPGYGGLPGHEGYPGFRGTEANALANAVSIGGGNAYSNAEANALSGGYGGLGGIGGLGDLGGLGGFGGYGGAEANALANAVSLGGGNAFSNAEANALAGGYGGPGSLGGYPGYGGLPGYDAYPGFRGTEANALANAVSIGGGSAYSNAEANALAGGNGGLGGFGGLGGLGGFHRDAEANAQANTLSSGGGNSFANAAANALSSGYGGNPFSSYSPFIGAIRSGQDTEGLLNTFTDLNVQSQESDNFNTGRILRDGITTDISSADLKSSRVEQENDSSKRKRIYRRDISDAEALANAESLRYGNELIGDEIDILTNTPYLGVYKGGITNANAIHLPFFDLSQAQSVGPKGILNSNSLSALHRGYYRDASNVGQTQEQFSKADARLQAIEENIRQAEAVINAGSRDLQKSSAKAKAQAEIIANSWKKYLGSRNSKSHAESDAELRYWGGHSNANALANAVSGSYRGLYGRQNEISDDTSDSNSRYWSGLNNWNGLSGLGGLSGGYSSANAQANAIAGGYRGLYGRQDESDDDISETNSRYWNGLNYWNGLSGLGGSQSSANAQANAIAGGYEGLYGRQDESDDDISETNSRYWNGLNYWNGLSGLGGSQSSANAQASAIAGGYRGRYGRQVETADDISETNSRYWNGLNYWKGLSGLGGSQSSASAQANAIAGGYGGLYGRQDESDNDLSDTNSRYWNRLNNWHGLRGLGGSQSSASAQANAIAGGYRGRYGRQEETAEDISETNSRYWNGLNYWNGLGGLGGSQSSANAQANAIAGGYRGRYGRQEDTADDISETNSRYWNGLNYWNGLGGLGGSQSSANAQANAIAGGYGGLYGREDESDDDLFDTNSRYWNRLNNWNGLRGLGGSQSSANAQANALAGGYRGLYGRQEETADEISDTNSRYWKGLNYWNGLGGLGGSQSSANAQANAIAGGYGGLYGRQDQLDDDVSDTNSRYWNGLNYWNGLSGLGGSHSSANAQANANAGAYGGLFGRQEEIADTVRSEQLRQSDANSRYLNKLGGGYSSANDIADAGIFSVLLGRQDINAKDRSIRSIDKSQGSKNSELESDANGRYWPRYNGYNGYDGYVPPYIGYNGYDGYDAYRPPYVSNYRLPYYGGYNELPYGGYNGNPYDNYNGGYLSPGLWNPYEIYRSEKDDSNTRQINRSVIKNIPQRLGGSQNSANAQANAIAGSNRGLYGRQDETADEISDTNSRYWKGLNYWNGLGGLGGSQSSANAQANAIGGGYGGLYGRQDESDDDVSDTNSRYWNGLNYWNGLSGLGGSHSSANAQANANAGAYGGLFGRQEEIADTVRSEQLRQSDANSRYLNKLGGGYSSANDIADAGIFSVLLGRQDINAKDRSIRSIVKSQGSKNSELESDANGRYWPRYNGYNGYDGYVPPYIGYNGYDGYDAYRPPYVSNYRLPYYGGYNELPYGGYNGYPYDNYNGGYLNPGLWNPYEIYRSDKEDPNTRQINRSAIKNIAQSFSALSLSN